MMQQAMQVRVWWAAVVIAASVVSAFQVSVHGGSVSVVFGVKTVTAALVALVWLPSLLRIFGWAGVNLKTPVGEASSGGLAAVLERLSPDARTDVLSTAAASLEEVQRTSRGTHQVEAARALTAVRQEMVTSAEESRTPLQVKLGELAERYDALRASTPSGSTRTRQLAALVEQAQAAVKADTGDGGRYLDDVLPRFDGLRGGTRVMALAALQALPLPVGAEAAGEAVLHAESPFEQYQALRALESIVAAHGPATGRPARAALEAALQGKATVPVRRTDRESLTTDLLRQL